MTDHNEEHLDLCAALAIGSITPEDRARLAEHLGDGCAECETALADFEVSTIALAVSVPPAMPRPEVRDQLLARIASEPRAEVSDGRAAPASPPAGGGGSAPRVAAPARPARNVFAIPQRPSFEMPVQGWMAVAAGFAVTTIAAVLWAMSLAGQVQKFRNDLLANAQVVEGLNDQLQQEKRWAEVLSSPDARFGVLSSTPSADVVMRGRVTFEPKSGSAVVVFENLRPPQGKVFELWAIHDTKPTSLGVIETDVNGRGIVRLENVGDPNRLVAFAVSLEKPGGSGNPHKPGGPVVLLGKV